MNTNEFMCVLADSICKYIYVYTRTFQVDLDFASVGETELDTVLPTAHTCIYKTHICKYIVHLKEIN